ncbi:hypothetical protein VaNZ11_010164 [Volvox africanus]|uniref:Armadillo-like repeats domain-containing protein n=1 Tax=Volvox africanus TaxID=51714 RepID=A0ABQ5SAB0_9CHLO|nr:hypothetical protein VaNZ11_010164 [Volvox africanus]
MMATQRKVLREWRTDMFKHTGKALTRCFRTCPRLPTPALRLHAPMGPMLPPSTSDRSGVTLRSRATIVSSATGADQGTREEEDFTEAERGADEDAAQMVAAAQEADDEAAAKAAAAIPAETDAVAATGQRIVSEDVEEVVEQVVEPLTFQSVAARSQAFLTTTLPGKLFLGGLAAAFVGSLLLATYRAWQKANTIRAKRMRQIDRNRELVEGINKYLLTGNRAGLTPGVMRKLQRSSGFSPVEVFRKYLWYLLRERKFDQGAVEDVVTIKVGLGLTDADAGEALRERATRIYDKYGTLMLNTEGLTLAGAQRKATCTALFRKVLYLAETERLVGPAAIEPGGSGVGSVADIGKMTTGRRQQQVAAALLEPPSRRRRAGDEPGPAICFSQECEGAESFNLNAKFIFIKKTMLALCACSLRGTGIRRDMEEPMRHGMAGDESVVRKQVCAPHR